MTQHDPHVEAEIRDLPAEDGWRRCEQTGRARATCPCGLDTGFIPKQEAWGIAASHPAGT